MHSTNHKALISSDASSSEIANNVYEYECCYNVVKYSTFLQQTALLNLAL